MTIFLAPVPIVHVQSMLDDMRQGYKRFAFGSNALSLFENSIPVNCESENILSYIYVSKAGEASLDAKAHKQLGIFIQGRLVGWSKGDNRRGQYQGTARRPTSAIDDGPMSCFWEIDMIEPLADRLPISDFAGVGGKPFEEGFVPQGPLLLSRRT